MLRGHARKAALAHKEIPIRLQKLLPTWSLDVGGGAVRAKGVAPSSGRQQADESARPPPRVRTACGCHGRSVRSRLPGQPGPPCYRAAAVRSRQRHGRAPHSCTRTVKRVIFDATLCVISDDIRPLGWAGMGCFEACATWVSSTEPATCACSGKAREVKQIRVSLGNYNARRCLKSNNRIVPIVR